MKRNETSSSVTLNMRFFIIGWNVVELQCNNDHTAACCRFRRRIKAIQLKEATTSKSANKRTIIHQYARTNDIAA